MEGLLNSSYVSMEQEKYVCKYMEQHGNEVEIMGNNVMMHDLQEEFNLAPLWRRWDLSRINHCEE